MTTTYQGTLDGDRIVWDGPAPAAGQKLRVQVTVVEPNQMSDAERRRRMLEALEALAALPERSFPADAVAWQRDIRNDRPLPGREEG